MLKILAILVAVTVKSCAVELWTSNPLEIIRKTAFLKVITNKPIIHNLRDFTNSKKKTQKAVLLSYIHHPNNLKLKSHRSDLPTV